MGRGSRLTSSVLALAALWLSGAPDAGAQSEPCDDPDFRIHGPTFLAVLVRDVDAAHRWYADVLALDDLKRIDDPDGRYSIRLLGGEGLFVELIGLRDADEPGGDRPVGLFKSGFFVDDIEAAHDWMRACGVAADEGIFTDDALGARSFVFRDPEGNRLQVFESIDEE